jgi:hypothetical protein
LRQITGWYLIQYLLLLTHLTPKCHMNYYHYSAINLCHCMREQVNLQWNDDEVRFVLDQLAELDFYSASTLKQQSVDRHVAPLWHINLITTIILSYITLQNKLFSFYFSEHIYWMCTWLEVIFREDNSVCVYNVQQVLWRRQEVSVQWHSGIQSERMFL